MIKKFKTLINIILKKLKSLNWSFICRASRKFVIRSVFNSILVRVRFVQLDFFVSSIQVRFDNFLMN
jgi:hypothetical protein